MEDVIRHEINVAKKKRYELMKLLVEIEYQIVELDIQLDEKNKALTAMNQAKRQ